MTNTKACSRCKQILSFEYFGKSSSSKSGLQSACKTCKSIEFKNWAKNNPEKQAKRYKDWVIKNPDRHRSNKTKWNQANPEKARIRTKQWAKDNPEKKRAANREWAKNNPEKIRQKENNWRKNNRDKARAANHRRRAKLKNCAVYSVTTAEYLKIYNRDCFYCGSTNKPTLDHLIPIDRNGSHGIGNFITLCHSCNSSKRNRTWMEFRMMKIRHAKELAMLKGNPPEPTHSEGLPACYSGISLRHP